MTDTYTPALTNEQIAKVIHDRVATKILAGEPIDPQDWFDYAGPSNAQPSRRTSGSR